MSETKQLTSLEPLESENESNSDHNEQDIVQESSDSMDNFINEVQDDNEIESAMNSLNVSNDSDLNASNEDINENKDDFSNDVVTSENINMDNESELEHEQQNVNNESENVITNTNMNEDVNTNNTKSLPIDTAKEITYPTFDSDISDTSEQSNIEDNTDENIDINMNTNMNENINTKPTKSHKFRNVVKKRILAFVFFGIAAILLITAIIIFIHYMILCGNMRISFVNKSAAKNWHKQFIKECDHVLGYSVVKSKSKVEEAVNALKSTSLNYRKYAMHLSKLSGSNQSSVENDAKKDEEALIAKYQK